jgi:tryptophan synthase alpha chain
VRDLEAALRARRDAGVPGLVAYVTGGAPGVDAKLLRAIAAGADAVEVGIPFSDPVMDGPVIQEASRLALERGIRPTDVLAMIAEADLDVPVAVMTYFNPVFRRGLERFLADASEAGVGGVIVPDLPVDEAEGWVELSSAASVAPVFLAAPGSSAERLSAIAASARGFVYCVSTFGVTGERRALAATAERLVDELRPLTDLPLLVGVGIATPEQASAACAFADGVVVGSAIVRRLLEGDTEGAVALVTKFRAALPVGGQPLPSR